MRVRNFSLFLGGVILLLAAAVAQQSAPAPQDTTSQTQAPAEPAKPQATPPATPPAEQPPATTRANEGQKPTSSSTSATPSAPEEDNPVTKIIRVVNEVNVVFTVTDKHGRYVKNLKKDDFHVIDDSKPAEEIRSFHSETDLPLQVGLLVDASNSVRDRFKFEQESAIEFLNQT